MILPSIISSILAFPPLIPPPSPSIIVLLYYSLTSSLIVTVPCTLAWPFLTSLLPFFFSFFRFLLSFFIFIFESYFFYSFVYFIFKKIKLNKTIIIIIINQHFMPYPHSAVTVTATLTSHSHWLSPCTKRQGPAGFLDLYAYGSLTYFITYHLLPPTDWLLLTLVFLDPISSFFSRLQLPFLPLDSSDLDLQVWKDCHPHGILSLIVALHCILYFCLFGVFGLLAILASTAS